MLLPIQEFPRRIRKTLKYDSVSDRFDSLFGLTYALNFYNSWMNDHEMWCEPSQGLGEIDYAVKALARAWRRLLAHSTSVLGIDEEYTKQGIEVCRYIRSIFK